jgi:hypothetical protein
VLDFGCFRYHFLQWPWTDQAEMVFDTALLMYADRQAWREQQQRGPRSVLVFLVALVMLMAVLCHCIHIGKSTAQYPIAEFPQAC